MSVTLWIIYVLLVTEDFCSNVVPHCEDTGGKCIFDQSQTTKCSCPTGTDYDKKVGCKGIFWNMLSAIISDTHVFC